MGWVGATTLGRVYMVVTADPARRPARRAARTASPPRCWPRSSSRPLPGPVRRPSTRGLDGGRGVKALADGPAGLRRLHGDRHRRRAHLRQRRQERELPAAERVQARALDPHQDRSGSTCRSPRRCCTCSSPGRLTIGTMVWISRRMAEKPNRTQTAVEVAYDLTKNNITGGNLEGKMALRWFPFLATLFFFIWFSNMIGYIPLPTNTEHPVRHLRRSRCRRSRSTRRPPTSRSRWSLTLIVWSQLPRRGDPGQGPHPVLQGLAALRHRGHDRSRSRASSS